jgi:hypothetical protein
MGRQAKYALLLLAGVLALAAWLRWFRSDEIWRTGSSGWGQGELKVSERAYYMNRISSAIDAARIFGWQAERGSEGRGGESAFVCLVIDTAGKQLWIESDGRILPEYHTDLPPSMDWKLYRSTPDGTTQLRPFGRFRLPTDLDGRFVPEQVSLVGTRGRRESLYFSFGPDSGSSNYAQGSTWSAQSINWPSSPKRTVDSEPNQSVIVSDADYEKAKAGFKAADSTPAESATLRENKAAWERAEKRLYEGIEGYLSTKGLRLGILTLIHGPDYTAARAQLSASSGGLRNILRSGSGGSVWLNIDYLGNDVWYTRSTQLPQHPMPIPPRLDLEFLIPVAGQIAKKDIPALLAEGRRKQQDLQPPSKWRVNLPNGASIEFIGVCGNPSGGKPWWGPDGSPLGYAPYVDREGHDSPPGDIAAYEMAWRIHPVQGPGSGTRVSFEGRSSSGRRQVYDRYGNLLREGLEAHDYVCDKSRTKTTLKIGVPGINGEFAWATFKNISLVRGENQGFEVIEGGAGE